MVIQPVSQGVFLGRIFTSWATWTANAIIVGHPENENRSVLSMDGLVLECRKPDRGRRDTSIGSVMNLPGQTHPSASGERPNPRPRGASLPAPVRRSHGEGGRKTASVCYTRLWKSRNHVPAMCPSAVVQSNQLVEVSNAELIFTAQYLVNLGLKASGHGLRVIPRACVTVWFRQQLPP